jgi:hypothetical protein
MGGLHNLFSSPDIIRQIKSKRKRWEGHVARMGEGRNVYGVLAETPEGKRPLGRPRPRWDDGIKMDFKAVGWRYGVDSPCSGQGPVGGSGECSDESPGSGATEVIC